MSIPGLVMLFVAMVGFFLLPIGLWRILAGAFTKERRSERARSGMSMISIGVFLLVAGVICQPFFSEGLWP